MQKRVDPVSSGCRDRIERLVEGFESGSKLVEVAMRDDVDLIQGDDPRTAPNDFRVQLKLPLNQFVILDRIRFVDRRRVDDMHEHSVALHMTQKLMAQSSTLARALD